VAWSSATEYTVAAVEGYLRQDNPKFWRETQEVPNFSVDLLDAIKATLKTIHYSNFSVNLKDPISGEKFQLPTSDSKDLIH
jgi:hypothetical protein